MSPWPNASPIRSTIPALPDMLYAGSLVFAPHPGISYLQGWSQRRDFRKGAEFAWGDKLTPDGRQITWQGILPFENLAPNSCKRCRHAARHAEAMDTSTSHLSFRCVLRPS